MDTKPFDDRDGLIWLDGQMVPWRQAGVHVLTHGLHYASSVFEGERVYDGEIFQLTEHSERLAILLGDAQDGQELGHRDVWVAPHEMDDAMVGAAETVLGEDLVRVRGEVAVGVEEQLDALPELPLGQEKRISAGFYVNHVDIYGS